MVIRCKLEEARHDRTEAADTPERKPAAPRKSRLSLPFGSSTLNGISEIRTFFRTNEQPIYFVGPTAFNLLGIDRWVRNFQYVAYYDSWDGAPPAGVHARRTSRTSSSSRSEEINNYLLRDPEVQAHIEAARRHARWSRWSSSTRRPRRSARSSATT